MSSVDSLTPMVVEGNPTTKGVYVHIVGDDAGVGGGTQYTEDVAAAADPVGNALMMVRDDALSGQTTTDGDNVAVRGTDKGEMYVKHADSIAVTGTFYQATQPVSGTVTANLGTIADVATQTTLAAINTKLASGTVIGDVNLGATDNAVLDAIAASVSSIDTDATTIIGHLDGVEGLLTTIDADTSALNALILATQADDIANTADGLQTSSFLYVFDGTTWDRLRGDATNGMLVNLGSNNDITLATLPDTASSDLAAINTAVTELAGAVNGAQYDVDLKATDLDLMLGTDFSSVLGTASLILATQADDVANTSDGIQTSSFLYVFDGTTWDRLKGDSTDGMLVNLGANNDITGTVDLGATDNAVLDAIAASVAAIDTDATTIIGHVDGIEALLGTIDTDTSGIITAVQLIDNMIYVDDADWTADTSSHALVGTVTQVAPTANTDGDTTPLISDALRQLRTAAPESDLAAAGTSHVKKYYTNAGAVTDGIIWSPAAGKRWYCTLLAINVSAAATVTIEDDLAAGDSAVMKFELAANSGVVVPFGDVPMFSGEDAADLLITTSAGNCYVTAIGYEI